MVIIHSRLPKPVQICLKRFLKRLVLKKPLVNMFASVLYLKTLLEYKSVQYWTNYSVNKACNQIRTDYVVGRSNYMLGRSLRHIQGLCYNLSLVSDNYNLRGN